MLGLRIGVRDQDVTRRLDRVLRGTRDLTPLHKRMGVKGAAWVARNFQRGGSPRWDPLSPNTVAQRRQGSSVPLQDRGLLRQSFAWEASGQHAVIGSALRIAEYHDLGTRPYTITPKTAELLRFMTVNGFVSVRRVDHPGLPKRKMLPTSEQATEEITRPTAEQYIRELIGR